MYLLNFNIKIIEVENRSVDNRKIHDPFSPHAGVIMNDAQAALKFLNCCHAAFAINQKKSCCQHAKQAAYSRRRLIECRWGSHGCAKALYFEQDTSGCPLNMRENMLAVIKSKSTTNLRHIMQTQTMSFLTFSYVL